LWLNQEYIKNATPEHLIEHLEWHLQHQKIDIDELYEYFKNIEP
jgi:hypothetical protein